MKVLVTGGTGFVGQRLQLKKPNWIYISSKECDLTCENQVNKLFSKVKPEAILHLAARVGGIKDNVTNQADFYYKNTMINTNVIHQAHINNINRVVSSLSTCAFPDRVSRFPYIEEDFFNGPPTITNFSYGMTKRMLHVSSCAYRNQYGRNYSTFCPSNIYGPGDHFNKESSHFVAALVHKIATTQDNSTIELWGTGNPLRQQLYVDDLCDIIPLLMEKHDSDVPLIVAPNENLSILEMAKILIKKSGKKIKLQFNGALDGQFRKDGNNLKLINTIGNYEFTQFKDGVGSTYKWYLENLNEQ
mgnify:CR=1 FL=1|tara:strand:- start:3577 stop:4482 length:906 start_codon:yes stop_codon:yes gene_type:complete